MKKVVSYELCPRYSVTLQLICALSVTEKMFMYKMPYFCIRYTTYI